MQLKLFTYSLLFILSTHFIWAQSDNPCGAPLLNVADGNACSFQQGTNAGATNTPGIPSPGCASYSGSDVWYQAVVPANGSLSIDMSQGSFSDGGMAWYSAPNCNGPFTLIQCNDDGSENGLMPKITRTNLTPGQIIYVRVWRYAGGTGTFRICATSPTPPEDCIGAGNFDCSTAQAFCTDEDMTYCNAYGDVYDLGQYSCLYSSPDAMWLYMEVATSGNISVNIHQTNMNGNPIDVDFALYGPYTDLASGCSVIGPNTPTVACSYSIYASETVNIPNAQAGQTYILLVTNYNGQQGSISFTNNTSSTATTDCSIVLPCSVATTMVPDTCSQSSGVVTATPENGTSPYTYSWDAPGNPTSATVDNLPPGTYTVTMTAADGCEATSSITVENITTTATATSTLVSCPGGNDGTATAQMTPVLGTLSYLWDDPLAQTSQTAVGLTAGTYNCVITSSTGCSNTVTVIVNEIPGMVATFSTISDVLCHGMNNGILTVNVSQGTLPYSYSWSGSVSTTNTADDLYAGTHIVTITDSLGCTITLSHTLSEPNPLNVSFITPDSQICPEDSIQLTVSGTGGSSDYIFTWSSNGNTIGTGNTIIVNPQNTNTDYCIHLSEICGSSPVDSCMTITFPTPIPPVLTSDKYIDCRPGEFFIENNSPNIGELATTYINFGNNSNGIILNGGDTTIVYENPGSYTFEVINTSIYGCVYDTVLNNFLIVTPDPVSNFYIAGNPTTIFETTLTAHELASNDVVQWEWISPYSQPSFSNLEDPEFTFPGGVEGIYPITLIVTSAYGCTDTLTLNAIVEEGFLFFVPNTFTPDGDEFNQTWNISLKGSDLFGFNLKVYNRWGEIVWETNDSSVEWDGTHRGKPLQQGTYSWKATIKNKNNDGRTEYNGIVTLLR